MAEAPRRRRSRRAASRTESPVEQSVVTVQAEQAAPPARRSRRSRARIVEDAEPTLALDVPSADRDVGASTVQTSLPESTMVTDVAAESAVDVAAVPVPSAAPAAVSEAPPQPDRPKRSGWWQRAKATITGE